MLSANITWLLTHVTAIGIEAIVFIIVKSPIEITDA